jgi:hypothetical protein
MHDDTQAIKTNPQKPRIHGWGAIAHDIDFNPKWDIIAFKISEEFNVDLNPISQISLLYQMCIKQTNKARNLIDVRKLRQTFDFLIAKKVFRCIEEIEIVLKKLKEFNFLKGNYTVKDIELYNTEIAKKIESKKKICQKNANIANRPQTRNDASQTQNANANIVTARSHPAEYFQFYRLRVKKAKKGLQPEEEVKLQTFFNLFANNLKHPSQTSQIDRKHETPPPYNRPVTCDQKQSSPVQSLYPILNLQADVCENSQNIVKTSSILETHFKTNVNTVNFNSNEKQYTYLNTPQSDEKNSERTYFNAMNSLKKKMNMNDTQKPNNYSIAV